MDYRRFFTLAKYLLLFVVITLLFSDNKANATKLINVQVVDQDYIMIYFKDGEVVYRDNGKGQSAFTGHDYAPGDDSLIVYGESLNVEHALNTQLWTITSNDDKNYRNGLFPEEVYRKSKANNTDHNWEFKHDHWIFLKLPEPMKNGKSYRLDISPELNSNTEKVDFTFDYFTSKSEAIHVNIIGYPTNIPVKSADLYLWMGDGGQRDYKSFEGNKVWIYNVETSNKQKVGAVSFWKCNDEKTELMGKSLTGSDVWNIDIQNFNQPGKYRLVVEGVGCSEEFEIRDDIYFEPFKTSLRGYYYMRIGEDRMDMNPVPRRPTFIPGKDPEGFTIYMTDLDPFDPEWHDHKGDTWDEPHFKPARESMFWKRRLPGNPVNPNARGGHSDALDWDRHLAHVSNIYDILLPYILTQGSLDDDNLDIGESGNGIPDVIDEARNEVDLWLSLRVGEAYAHGLTNPSSERNIMFQAGVTNMAAWANAANCAMLAECFRISGHEDLMQYYMQESIKAYQYADRQENKQLDDLQDIGDNRMRGRDFKMMAAAYLYNLTGDKKWEDVVAAESVVKDSISMVQNIGKWEQTWATVAYLFSPHEVNYPGLYKNMALSIKHQAHQQHIQYLNQRPSRRSSVNRYWQTPHNLQIVLLAHAIEKNTDNAELLEKAMYYEADWGLGRNPSNMVEMTGLGERSVVNCYTSGRNDGTPGLHPGHTPYNNLNPWGKKHNGANPQWFVARCYPEWNEGGWPQQEGHFNSRYSWANGEFTPRQTMRGKMALYGYLYGISKK